MRSTWRSTWTTALFVAALCALALRWLHFVSPSPSLNPKSALDSRSSPFFTYSAPDAESAMTQDDDAPAWDEAPPAPADAAAGGDGAAGAAADATADASPRLPRTYPGEYGKLNAKELYFMYSPSGGFSNQRVELENALMIGRMLNRTVLVPPIGKHTQMWWKYEALLPVHLYPADCVLDFARLLAIQKVVPFEEPIAQFLVRVEKQLGKEKINRVFSYGNLGWTSKDLAPFKLQLAKQVLFFRGGNMYHDWRFNENVMAHVRDHVRLAPHIRSVAIALTRDAFPLGEFNAVHVRLGDYTGRTPPAYTFYAKTLNRGFKLSVPLYVATEPNPDKKFFANLCGPGKFTCVFSADLDKHITTEFKSHFPVGQIRGDMLGLLEILVCVAAKRFLGTEFSTFSAFISSSRRKRRMYFPEITDDAILDDDE